MSEYECIALVKFPIMLKKLENKKEDIRSKDFRGCRIKTPEKDTENGNLPLK